MIRDGSIQDAKTIMLLQWAVLDGPFSPAADAPIDHGRGATSILANLGGPALQSGPSVLPLRHGRPVPPRTGGSPRMSPP